MTHDQAFILVQLSIITLLRMTEMLHHEIETSFGWAHIGRASSADLLI